MASHIAIIGGGVGGLNAEHELRRSGYRGEVKNADPSAPVATGGAGVDWDTAREAADALEELEFPPSDVILPRNPASAHETPRLLPSDLVAASYSAIGEPEFLPSDTIVLGESKHESSGTFLARYKSFVTAQDRHKSFVAAQDRDAKYKVPSVLQDSANLRYILAPVPDVDIPASERGHGDVIEVTMSPREDKPGLYSIFRGDCPYTAPANLHALPDADVRLSVARFVSSDKLTVFSRELLDPALVFGDVHTDGKLASVVALVLVDGRRAAHGFRHGDRSDRFAFKNGMSIGGKFYEWGDPALDADKADFPVTRKWLERLDRMFCRCSFAVPTVRSPGAQLNGAEMSSADTELFYAIGAVSGKALAALPSLARWWSAMLRTPAKSRPAARARVVVEIGVLA